jgi:hypothetical protein
MTGLKMQVSSPDDIILAKLKRTKLCGGSGKQFIDAIRALYGIMKCGIGNLT